MLEKYLWFYVGNHCCSIIQTGKIVLLHSGRVNSWSDKVYQLALRPTTSITEEEYSALLLKYNADEEDVKQITSNARMTADLIHLNIDVFNLIEQKLAYDIYRQ